MYSRVIALFTTHLVKGGLVNRIFVPSCSFNFLRKELPLSKEPYLTYGQYAYFPVPE